jgi:hypothetical protein
LASAATVPTIQQVEPANLHSGETTECGTDVEVSSAGFGKLRRNFREACQDQGHAQRGENHGEGAGSSEQTRELTGQTEYPTANDAIDDQSGHRPSSYRPCEHHRYASQ